jgi:small GTP-binding protein
MVHNRGWRNGFEVFYDYSFVASRPLDLKWSNSGNKLGWLTADADSCFLHIWNRIDATYDAIEISEVLSFSFEVSERFALLVDRNSNIQRLNLDTFVIEQVGYCGFNAARCIERSPDGKLIAVVSDRADVSVFDNEWRPIYRATLNRGRKREMRGREVCKNIAWHPNSQFLALAGYSVTVIDLHGGESMHYASGVGNYDVAWSPDGKWLASATSAKTVEIWDRRSNALFRVLEGHKADVRSISFSADGDLLASQSADGTIILWKCDDWSSLEVRKSSGRTRSLGRQIVFHPHFPWLAQTELGLIRSESATMVLSKFDPKAMERNAPVPTVTYASAKIVLVGESGTGKTGLGWRIANNSFKEHPSTHGQQFWLIDQLSSVRADGTQCEAVLWDLAGQPDYRLVHALFLDDVDVALVLFDPTKAEDPLHGIDYWLKQLAHRQIDGGKLSPEIILVAARVDRGTSRLTFDEINAFCQARGVRRYLKTSATSGEGVSELVDLLRELIPWDSKPATVTTETFKRIKDHVLRLKEAPSAGQSIVTLDELRRQLKSQSSSADFTKDELLSAVGHLATHGYVAILRSSQGETQILLIPELLNNLAASIILEARRNLRGLGSLDEQHLLDSESSFGELSDLTTAECSVLLGSTVSMLLQNNICYRETDPLNSRSYLVFPELINLKKPQFDDDVEVVDDVSYTVTGAISNVYASLVVLLGYTDKFTRTHQWRDHARYEFGKGMVCGFRLESEQEAELNFVLYFGVHVKTSAKSLFTSLFESFLASRDVTVQRYVPIKCSKGHLINRGVIKEQFAFGLSHAHCPRCGERVMLPEQNQTIQLTLEESRTVEYEERAARQRSIFEKAIYLLKSYASQRGVPGPVCFISYAWGDLGHERWVERFANDIMNAGISVILDRWDNEKIGSSVPRFVERAMGADRVLVVGTPNYRRKYENREPMSSYVVAAEGDIIGRRLIGTEEDKAKIMPILLAGSPKESFPDLLQSRVYGDFREGEEYVGQMMKLLLNLYEIRPRDKISTEIKNVLEEK